MQMTPTFRAFPCAPLYGAPQTPQMYVDGTTLYPQVDSYSVFSLFFVIDERNYVTNRLHVTERERGLQKHTRI